MTAKKKETQREKELKALILEMIELAGDKSLRHLFTKMNRLGISTEQIIDAVGYGQIAATALHAGLWIKVYWYDTEPSWLLLLETPDPKAKGDVSLKAYDPVTEDVNSHAMLSQVIDFKEGPKAPE